MIFNLVIGTAGGAPFPAPGTALADCTWAEIAAVSNAGKAREYFALGDQINVDIGGTAYAFEIIGFDHDDKADGSGKAGITFYMVDMLNDAYSMNASSTNAGGWKDCALRSTLQTSIYEQLPKEVRNVITPVTKYSSDGNGSLSLTATSDTLWLACVEEIQDDANDIQYVAGEGTVYARFDGADASERVKNYKGSTYDWWMRSPSLFYEGTWWCIMASYGVYTSAGATGSYGVSFGFCV